MSDETLTYCDLVLIGKIRELTSEEQALMKKLKDELRKKFDENED